MGKIDPSSVKKGEDSIYYLGYEIAKGKINGSASDVMLI
jgi:hypothetical protein